MTSWINFNKIFERLGFFFCHRFCYCQLPFISTICRTQIFSFSFFLFFLFGHLLYHPIIWEVFGVFHCYKIGQNRGERRSIFLRSHCQPFIQLIMTMLMMMIMIVCPLKYILYILCMQEASCHYIILMTAITLQIL